MDRTPAPKILTLIEYEAATALARRLATTAVQQEVEVEQAKITRAKQRRRIVELQTRKLIAEAETLRQQIAAIEARLESARRVDEEAARARQERDATTYGNLELLAAEAADWSRRHPDALRKLTPNRTLRKVS